MSKAANKRVLGTKQAEVHEIQEKNKGIKPCLKNKGERN